MLALSAEAFVPGAITMATLSRVVLPGAALIVVPAASLSHSTLLPS